MATTVRKDKESKGDRYPGSKPVDKVKKRGSTALYGRSGTGKTTLASTWPKPILYLNINDNGTDSICDLGDEIDVKDITNSGEMRDVILWVIGQQNKGKLRYKTIVLDTLTQFQQILVVEKAGEKGKKEIRGSKGKRPGDFGTLTKQDWGSIAGDMKALIADVRNLDMEVVFIAQERTFNIGDEEQEDEQLQPEVGARLSPSVNADLCASVNTIGNTFIRVSRKKKKIDGKIVWKKKTQYCLRIGPHEIYTTKIRKPIGVSLPDFIVDPSFAKLSSTMKGTK